MIEAIKKGFAVAAKNLQLVLIVYGAGVIFGLISLPFARQMAMGAVGGVPRISAGLLLVIFLSALVQIFVMGGVLGSIREVVKKGAVKMGEFVNFGSKYYIKLFLSGLLGMVIFGLYGAIFALLVGGIAAGPIAVKVILGLLLALYIICGVVISLMLVFWPYAIVTEEAGVIDGLKKSIKIAIKPVSNLGKIFAILFIIVAGAVLINLIFSFPQIFFGRWLVVMNIYRIFILGAVGSFINVFWFAVLMVYYFTLKGENAAPVTAGAPEGTSSSTETPGS